MNKRDLLKLLEPIPYDATVCVRDSYGAFSDFNHFEKAFSTKKVLVDGKVKLYYVIGTEDDEEGYSEYVEEKPLRKTYHHSGKVANWLSALFPKADVTWFSYSMRLDTWCPKVLGGTKEDQEQVKMQAEEYWSRASTMLGLPKNELENKTLGDVQ
ncbi:MAG: hypothetical protein Tp178MES00d2C33159851_138 [Prokaryotic dsDNA virus sp.]|nr:MAG: hypothetical protein Tp178MES00d2C33159851_138 [Prokaryotic dsDNA virus sp.]|tara:strand:+ start:12243 stop:12707 length:465 start_codon:yes stop_codon:yes gene_type:complete